MPVPNWIRIVTKQGKKYIKPQVNNLSLTDRIIGPSLIEAQRYKQSQGYKDLVQRFSREATTEGFDFPGSLFFGSEKTTPSLKLMDLPVGNLGSYSYTTNTLKLDPKQLIGREIMGTPLHESIHWQRIGLPDLSTPKYRAWGDAVDKDLSEEIKHHLWSQFYLDPMERKMFNAKKSVQSYLDLKAKRVLHDNAYPYLIQPGELQANGIEAGRMIGLNYFEPYPGYKNARDAIVEARNYNSYLTAIKANTDKNAQDFWRILTGNYLPSIAGASALGTVALKNNNE